ncbi:uncharacterized protein LOC128226946 [Mya arenaria]|uniref:uncharacterized protein LOC128226946 n=1 Tax=Mya arenaria TaxID=6604 RepID=UPI0022E0E2C5|nr:uncharacterized protein LOC128226946 [Mya arenaria]
MTVGTLVQNFGIKVVEFTCIDLEASVASTSLETCAKEATEKAVDAFQLLMAGGRRFTSKKESSHGLKTGLSRKDELYNNLIDDFKTKGLDFPKGTEAVEGSYIVQCKSVHLVLCNALWYITNHHTTINDAAARYKDVLPVPPAFENYDGYNDVKRKKIKMTQMSARELESHSQALYSLLMKPVVSSTAKWLDGKKEIEQLAECLGSYNKYLEKKNSDSLNIQNRTEPARTIDKHATLETRMGSPFGVNDKYELLNKAVISEGVNSYVVFDETVHLERPFKTPDEKYKYFKKLQLSVPVDLIKFCPGGSLEATVCIRQVTPNRSEPQILTDGARFLQNVRPVLGEIHTRLQRMSFKSKIANIATISPAISDFIYTHLTLDKSAAENPVTRERLRLIFSGQTGLVKDLIELNPGRPNNKFDSFFNVLSGIVEEVTSADDRRHGEAHMSQFISLDEMIQQAKSQCPEGTAVPSKSLVRLQFAPKNPFTKIATTFTSKLNVQYKIQKRQLRVAHPDEHFCNAQFRYMKECAIENKEKVKLLFCDDKAKVPFGNPGALLSTGVRGKKTIVPVTSTLSALDHDMQSSGSLTPSVYLDCQIPDSPVSSFVRGQVGRWMSKSQTKAS